MLIRNLKLFKSVADAEICYKGGGLKDEVTFTITIKIKSRPFFSTAFFLFNCHLIGLRTFFKIGEDRLDFQTSSRAFAYELKNFFLEKVLNRLEHNLNLLYKKQEVNLSLQINNC